MGKEQFSHQITKIGKVLVYWHGANGKREIVLKGARAEKLIEDLPGPRATSNAATSAPFASVLSPRVRVGR
jgi:hypothetical protein